jgi:hypothetical protein
MRLNTDQTGHLVLKNVLLGRDIITVNTDQIGYPVLTASRWAYHHNEVKSEKGGLWDPKGITLGLATSCGEQYAMLHRIPTPALTSHMVTTCTILSVLKVGSKAVHVAPLILRIGVQPRVTEPFMLSFNYTSGPTTWTPSFTLPSTFTTST